MTTGADLFVASLAAGGVDTVYALPGEETAALMDAFARSDISVVLCRHEQSAAFMASVHGRLTGQPAACLATLGPGATNLITGVADAMLDRVPLIAITGQAKRDRLARGPDSHQVIDLTRLFEPVTKLSRTIKRAEDIPGSVAEALRVALDPRPGAVHLSLPEDLAGDPADGAPLPQSPRTAPHFNPTAISDALTAMVSAERPIVLAGAGVLRGGASAALEDLITETGLPLATSFMAKGLLPADHPQHLGAFGLPVEDHVDRAIGQADLLILVGYDPVEYPLAKLTKDGETRVLNIAETSLASDLGHGDQTEMLGDLEASLSALRHALEARRWPMWEAAEHARNALIGDLNDAAGQMDDAPPTALSLVAALNATTAPEDLVLSGVGTHKLALARGFMPKRPGQIIIANGLAGMGMALPGAIAAARLRHEGRVIAVCGDGDVMMNVQEMETATRLGLDLTVVVWIDGGYGLIEDKQEAETGARPDLSFAGIDWAQLAGSFGWSHAACATAADLQDMLIRRVTGRQLITVPVAYDGSLA